METIEINTTLKVTVDGEPVELTVIAPSGENFICEVYAAGIGGPMTITVTAEQLMNAALSGELVAA